MPLKVPNPSLTPSVFTLLLKYHTIAKVSPSSTDTQTDMSVLANGSLPALGSPPRRYDTQNS